MGVVNRSVSTVLVVVTRAYNKGDSRPRHLQGKGANAGMVRQAWGFLSLALCNLANFDQL